MGRYFLFLFAAVSISTPAMATSAQAATKLTPACAAAKAYFNYLDAKQAEPIGPLFADPTDYAGPDGVNLHRREEVVTGYARVFSIPRMMKPHRNRITILAPVGPRSCLMEFGHVDSVTGQVTPGAIDHFDVDERGLITYFRPYFVSTDLDKARAIVTAVGQLSKPEAPAK